MSNCLVIADSVQYRNIVKNGLDFTPPDRSGRTFDVPGILTIVAAFGGAIIISMEAIKFSF